MLSWKIRKPTTKRPEPVTSVAASGRVQQKEVDRAGEIMADALRAAADGTPRVGPGRAELLLEAIEIIDWWRTEHARPLSRVAANLRYYVADEDDAVVAQRLKKFPTIATSCCASRE